MSAPVLQALLLADHVYRDGATGKHVICGVFSAMRFIPKKAVPKPPQPGENVPIANLVRAGSPSVYLSLTELRGTYSLELRYVDLEDNSVLLATKFPLERHDPLETVEVTLQFPSLPTPHAGIYVLELLCDGQLLGSHRVRVVPDPNFKTEEPTPDTEPG